MTWMVALFDWINGWIQTVHSETNPRYHALLSMTSVSISVPMKHRNASSGVHTMGSPRTLKLVFTSTGQPVRRLNVKRSL
jgi:hypothetical protein